jgi:hypothetical protein
MRRRGLLAAVLLSIVVAGRADAAPTLVPVGTFAEPVHVAGPDGDASRLFVVERQGRVQIVVNGQTAATPFLDAVADVRDTGSEEGLLSIAFAPDYASSGLFYVFYTDNAGDLVVREGTRSAADANRGALGRVLFTVPHPVESNHNGGQLALGFDGLLYAGTGDGGGQGDPGDDAQNPNSRLGKILRLDPRVPSSLEVWALGLRNPWRFSFDRLTGDAVIGDVGGSVNEEIDFAPAGAPAGRNYGWVRCEGDQPQCPEGTVRPVVNLPRTAGYTGVIGGFVVRDPGLPTLHGRYVFGDLSKPTVLSAALGAETVPRAEPGLPVTFPTSFGEDGCGHLYVALNGGAVSRIQDGALGPCVVPPVPPRCCAPPAGQQPPQPASSDTVGCAIAPRAARRAQRILRRGRRLRLTLRASEACRATLRARRFRTRRNVALQPNVARVVRLAPTTKGLRRMRRALDRSDRGRLRISVRVSARDAAGNPTTARLRARVR